MQSNHLNSNTAPMSDFLKISGNYGGELPTGRPVSARGYVNNFSSARKAIVALT